MRLINADRPEPTNTHWEDSVTIERTLAIGEDEILALEGSSAEVTLYYLYFGAT